ncbi:unnamed protein product [Allacma fusca]|uniref:Uncharacterized protein n=1 Tax=Allacma fusca TaxID=39272 RepID=A0A8J2JRW7_9HEXA|nr:unnamed protein product [Allacma fusca]
MSFCHSLFNFVACGKDTAVQPLQNYPGSSHTQVDNSDVAERTVAIPLSNPTVATSNDQDVKITKAVDIPTPTMVDVRASSMIKPCLIGSPPPSVLRERSKLRRDRLAQSRLATNSQPLEETVLASTGANPAIHLSCSEDSPDDESVELVAIDQNSSVSLATNTNNSTSERSNSLTPPPRLISFNLPTAGNQ